MDLERFPGKWNILKLSTLLACYGQQFLWELNMERPKTLWITGGRYLQCCSVILKKKCYSPVNVTYERDEKREMGEQMTKLASLEMGWGKQMTFKTFFKEHFASLQYYSKMCICLLSPAVFLIILLEHTWERWGLCYSASYITFVLHLLFVYCSFQSLNSSFSPSGVFQKRGTTNSIIMCSFWYIC